MLLACAWLLPSAIHNHRVWPAVPKLLLLHPRVQTLPAAIMRHLAYRDIETLTHRDDEISHLQEGP